MKQQSKIVRSRDQMIEAIRDFAEASAFYDHFAATDGRTKLQANGNTASGKTLILDTLLALLTNQEKVPPKGINGINLKSFDFKGIRCRCTFVNATGTDDGNILFGGIHNLFELAANIFKGTPQKTFTVISNRPHGKYSITRKLSELGYIKPPNFSANVQFLDEVYEGDFRPREITWSWEP